MVFPQIAPSPSAGILRTPMQRWFFAARTIFNCLKTCQSPSNMGSNRKFTKEIGEMKAKLIAVLFIMLLAVAGCSSSGETTSSDSGKLATINTLLSKGYEMSQNQRETINQLVAEGKEFVAQGKQEEADKVFDQAIELLEVIGETDRFNKSE